MFSSTLFLVPTNVLHSYKIHSMLFLLFFPSSFLVQFLNTVQIGCVICLSIYADRDLYLVRWFVFVFFFNSLVWLLLCYCAIIGKMNSNSNAECKMQNAKLKNERKRKKNANSKFEVNVCAVIEGVENLLAINRWVSQAKCMIYAIVWMPIVWTSNIRNAVALFAVSSALNCLCALCTVFRNWMIIDWPQQNEWK